MRTLITTELKPLAQSSNGRKRQTSTKQAVRGGNIRLLYIATGLLLSSTALQAGQWTTGWGQGTSEYIAEVDTKNGLNIACNDINPVRMMATVNGKEYGSFASQSFNLVVDGVRYSTPYETNSRLGANNFAQMWNQLRQAKTITLETQDGQTLALPTAGVADALPATNSREFGCVMEIAADDTSATQDTAQANTIRGDELGARVYHDEYGRQTLEVISKVDMLVITGLTINRGNCSTLKENYPKRLAFGKSHQFYILPNACNILEAVVMTDRGPAEFGFE